MRRLWDIFASTGLTIALAASICAVAAWGSIITIRNQEFFSGLDRAVLFPTIIGGASGAESTLGLTYWVFALIFLTFLFTVNTFVCTADKLISIVRQKRPVGAFFPHIVHIGFLIAVVGHLVGSVWGFRSPVNILYQGSPVEVAEEPGLSVRLDGYELKVAETGRMESLKTRVTLIAESEEILTDDIEINGPLIYKGIAFYHMDQGETPGGLVFLVGSVGSGGASAQELAVDFGGSFTSADGAEYTLGEVYPDFALDADGSPYSRSPNFTNPYVEIISGAHKEFLPVSYPGRSVTFGHAPNVTTIKLLDYKMVSYVILTINKDPGILLIIAGSLVLVTGMALLLLFRGARVELVRRVDDL